MSLHVMELDVTLHDVDDSNLVILRVVSESRADSLANFGTTAKWRINLPKGISPPMQQDPNKYELLKQRLLQQRVHFA